MMAPADLPVVIAAGGAPWEAAALEVLSSRRGGLALHKRCVDLSDLVASSATGLARVALVGAGLQGVDADVVATLAGGGVGTVVVLDGGVDPVTRERMHRIGARAVVDDNLSGLADALLAAGEAHPDTDPTTRVGPGPEQPVREQTGRARRVVVWGPAGAPGRTTVATGLAAELAHRGRATVLIDADPYGGAVAQHLGVLDGASGLLAAARAANAGELDPTRLAGLARAVGVDGNLRVVTGLPRPDRWLEVRAAAFGEVLDAAERLGEWLVVDVGFSIEGDAADPYATGPQRNLMTTVALARADEVVVVGAADPVGLARLARGLVDLHDLVPDVQVTVVVNRARSSLGWSEHEIHGMVEGFVRARGVQFVPDDRPAADRALVAGRSLVESGDSALRRGVATLADTLLGEPAGRSPRRPRRRTRAPYPPNSR